MTGEPWWDPEPSSRPELDDHCELCGSADDDLMLGNGWPWNDPAPRTVTKCADFDGCRERRRAARRREERTQ